jgi:hypothetical protein
MSKIGTSEGFYQRATIRIIWIKHLICCHPNKLRDLFNIFGILVILDHVTVQHSAIFMIGFS